MDTLPVAQTTASTYQRNPSRNYKVNKKNSMQTITMCLLHMQKQLNVNSVAEVGFSTEL